MTLPQAWMQQAESDFRTAQRVDNDHDARTRCQAISRYQQCVEKSVKAVLDRLYGAGLIHNCSDRSHQVARYASVLTDFPAPRDNRDLLNQLRRRFTDAVVEQINLLDSLVPEYPATGALAKRNHE
jgi:HEPN domain-containing protein